MRSAGCPRGNMEETDIKITIDPNGNIRREVVERTQSEAKKPKLIKRLVSNLTF